MRSRPEFQSTVQLSKGQKLPVSGELIPWCVISHFPLAGGFGGELSIALVNSLVISVATFLKLRKKPPAFLVYSRKSGSNRLVDFHLEATEAISSAQILAISDGVAAISRVMTSQGVGVKC